MSSLAGARSRVALLAALLACAGPSFAESPTDAHLRGFVEAWLLHAHQLGSDRLRVEVVDGVVTLSGQLDDPQRIDAIVAAVAEIAGVVEVRSRVETSQRPSESRWWSWRRWLRPAEGRKLVTFPAGDLFADPIADQKQPRFHTTYQRYDTPFGGGVDIGSVGFGENFGLLRRPGPREGNGWQLGIGGAVFAIFDLGAESKDLLNADYYVGFLWSWRRGPLSGRARVFHLSSHLGDEFLLNPQPGPPVERINLSYEALELLGSWEHRGFRVYGGGIRIFQSQTPLGRDRAQLGFEYRGRLLNWRAARLVAGIDVQAWDETSWDRDVSIKAGLRFRGPQAGARSIMLLAEYYDGHAPHGQFYPLVVRYYGIGIAYSL